MPDPFDLVPRNALVVGTRCFALEGGVPSRIVTVTSRWGGTRDTHGVEMRNGAGWQYGRSDLLPISEAPHLLAANGAGLDSSDGTGMEELAMLGARVGRA